MTVYDFLDIWKYRLDVSLIDNTNKYVGPTLSIRLSGSLCPVWDKIVTQGVVLSEIFRVSPKH